MSSVMKLKLSSPSNLIVQKRKPVLCITYGLLLGILKSLAQGGAKIHLAKRKLEADNCRTGKTRPGVMETINSTFKSPIKNYRTHD